MKTVTIFRCETCNYESPKWLGKCPECDSWSSFAETTKTKGAVAQNKKPISQTPRQLKEFSTVKNRLLTDMDEVDLVLGGGFMAGSLTLLSGEPGIGKSTITMQICANLAQKNIKILYISGEESFDQIADRALRIGVKQEQIQILNESNLENIIDTLKNEKPDFLILDSIQVISSTELDSMAGSMNQIRYCTEELLSNCKGNNITALLIGHVTKDGNIAGPRFMEHLVDTVLYLEGDRYQQLRLLRSLKNRFGSTNELGVFEMTEKGLQEMKNPSSHFIEDLERQRAGSSFTITLEGHRPFILEVQALTSPTLFGYPRRTTNGFDLNRLHMLSAVIQKYLKLNIASQDAYINVVGGFELREPANDLSVIASILSSIKQIACPTQTIFIGEVGLNGEIRKVPNLLKRLIEAEKLGFKQAYIPSGSELPKKTLLQITQIKTVEELVQLFKS